MRLINADYLRSTYSITHAHFDSIESIRQWIDKVPTVDATPVRHGKWENFGEGYAMCSECGETTPWLYASDYCGHCGAEMEDDNETD